MFGRPAAPLVVVALLLGLLALGCGSRDAPEDAPALASAGSIPTAAPGAHGVTIPEPKVYGIATSRSYPAAPPTVPPMPTVVIPEVPYPPIAPTPPSPFVEPPRVKPSKPTKKPSTELEL